MYSRRANNESSDSRGGQEMDHSTTNAQVEAKGKSCWLVQLIST